ncbi:MAG: DUF2207 domain-containing protein, partial [Pseudomonadota bacterium]
MRIVFARVRTLIALVLLSASLFGTAQAQERILSFDSRVNVQKDGSFIVKETIRVRAEGRKIRRGIYRDFPLRFEGADGRERKVGFKLLSTRRDGQPESSRIEWSSRALRIYLGQSDVFLSAGEYTYEITYRTDRQLRRFENHVEVFWNATGNFWEFPIQKATATIQLPEGADAKDITYFTGRFGSKAQDASASRLAQGRVVEVVTSRPLGVREGLSVVVSFDPQFVDAPSAADETRWFLQDFAGEVITFGGAALAFLYYLFAWRRVGRDPPKDVVVPRWNMPQDVSPGLVNYIDNKGISGKGFAAISAAALSLAVKGHMELKDIGDTVTFVTKTKTMPKGLPTGERVLMNKVIGNGGKLNVTKANGTKVKSLSTRFSKAMDKEHRSVFYKANIGWIIPGLILSIICLIAAVLMSGRVEEVA